MDKDYRFIEKIRSMISIWLQMEHDIAPGPIIVKVEDVRIDVDQVDILLDVQVSLPVKLRHQEEK